MFRRSPHSQAGGGSAVASGSGLGSGGTGQGVEEDDGVGDDKQSWAFDGFRQKKWNKEDADYGSSTNAAKNTTATAKSTAKKTASTAVTASTTAAAKGKSTAQTAASSSSSSSSHTDNTDAAAAVDDDDGEGPTPWQPGDVVGCLLSFSEAAGGRVTGASMSYMVNGVSLGEAFGCEDTAEAMAVVQSDYEKVGSRG